MNHYPPHPGPYAYPPQHPQPRDAGWHQRNPMSQNPMSQNPMSQNPMLPYPFPQAPRPPQRRGGLVRLLAIGFGVLLALGFVSTLLSGGDGDALDTGGYSGGSGGSSQIYDSGSITTTGDGELIYSDNSGNSFSTGG